MNNNEINNSNSFQQIKTKSNNSLTKQDNSKKSFSNKSNSYKDTISKPQRLFDNYSQTTLEDDIEYFNIGIQTKIKSEAYCQTEFRELMKKEESKLNELNLEIFLKKSLILIEEALNSREDETLESKFFIFFSQKIF